MIALSPAPRQRLPATRVVLITAGVVLIIGALDAFSAVTDYRMMGGTRAWEPVVWSFSSVIGTGILFHPLNLLVGRLPIHRHNWARRLCQHLAAGLVFSVLHTVLMVAMRELVYAVAGRDYDFGDPRVHFPYELSKDLLTYGSLVLGCYAYRFWDGLRKEQIRVLSLESEMAEQRLRRLREQLKPHFLFNTLNLISSCMYEDVEKADKLIADLCTLLRYYLAKESPGTHTLEEELAFLRLYLGLIEARFSGRFRACFAIEPGMEKAHLPRFLLQPLAENAVEHGFLPRAGKGTLTITVRRQADRLQIRVADDGAGPSEPTEMLFGKGLGLGNNLAILSQLYPDDFRFELSPVPSGGTAVDIDLPYHTEQTPEDVSCVS